MVAKRTAYLSNVSTLLDGGGAQPGLSPQARLSTESIECLLVQRCRSGSDARERDYRRRSWNGMALDWAMAMVFTTWKAPFSFHRQLSGLN